MPGKAGFPAFSATAVAGTAASAYALESACLSPAEAFRSGISNLTFFGCISGSGVWRLARVAGRSISLSGAHARQARKGRCAASLSPDSRFSFWPFYQPIKKAAIFTPSETPDAFSTGRIGRRLCVCQSPVVAYPSVNRFTVRRRQPVQKKATEARGRDGRAACIACRLALGIAYRRRRASAAMQLPSRQSQPNFSPASRRPAGSGAG